MAVHENFSSAFRAMHRRIAGVSNTLPSAIANEGTNFFLGSFDKEGFEDTTLNKWSTPQRKIPGTNAFKYPKGKGYGRRTRKTLVETGKLRRAVNNSVKSKSISRVVWEIGSEVPYAARHNEGLNGMPKREFMGESRELNKRFKRKITEAYRQAFR